MAFDPNKPANDGFLADAPQELRTNFAGLKDDQIVNAGSLRGLVPGNASGNIPISNGTLNTNLNADKVDGLDASDFASASHVHSVATGSSNGFMSNTDKQKLDGIQTGAEVNQNAFSNILVGGTTIQADSKTDTLELVAGTNISLSPDATNDRVTINCTYTHPTGDGNLHVPATGTSNNGKVLKAGASAGSIAWGTLSASDITNTPAGNISATTVQAAINELDSEKVSVSEVVTTATANKILKLDSNGKLPASITGDAATVSGKTPGTGANQVLVLDGSGKVPPANLPIASASALGAIKVGANLSIDGNGVLSALSTAFDAGKSFATNGYQKLSNGLIIQWMYVNETYPNNTLVTLTYPIAFPNAFLNGQISRLSNANDYGDAIFIKNPTKTQCSVYTALLSTGYPIMILLIGY